MTAEERADAAIKTFDAAEVAAYLTLTKTKWMIKGSLRRPNARDVRESARALVIKLLNDAPEVTTIESGGIMVSRRGTRIGVAYCPVYSEDFP